MDTGHNLTRDEFREKKEICVATGVLYSLQQRLKIYRPSHIMFSRLQYI